MKIEELKILYLKPLKPFAENDPQIQVMCDRVKKFGILKPIFVNNLTDCIILDGNKLYAALIKMYGSSKGVPVLPMGIDEKDAWPVHVMLNSKPTAFRPGSMDNYIDPYLDDLRCKLNKGLTISAYLDVDSPQKDVEELHKILENVIQDELEID